MDFKYHGYNVDLNNEIPYECVPNALVKMYGKQEEMNIYLLLKMVELNMLKNVLIVTLIKMN